MLESIGRVGELTDIAQAESEVARLIASWGEMAGVDDAAAARFEQGRQSALALIAERRRETEEAAERARQRDEALATGEALCVRVETLEGDDILEQLVPIEEEWRSLAPLVGNGPEADRLAERLARAMTACRKRHELGAVLVETRVRLEALVVDAEGVLAQDNAAAAAARWQEISREARGMTAVLEDGRRPAADLVGAPDSRRRGIRGSRSGTAPGGREGPSGIARQTAAAGGARQSGPQRPTP